MPDAPAVPATRPGVSDTPLLHPPRDRCLGNLHRPHASTRAHRSPLNIRFDRYWRAEVISCGSNDPHSLRSSRVSFAFVVK